MTIHLSLHLHPDSRGQAAVRIEAGITRLRPDALMLDYCVTGEVGDVRLPPPSLPGRADGLWQHSCFEAFLRVDEGPVYYEFNFAPSRQWAAYRFSDYRQGMEVVAALEPPVIECAIGDAHYRLRATLAFAGLPELAGASAWTLGLAAVIEEKRGAKSYWALAHPSGKADFHHPAGLICKLEGRCA